MRDGVGWLEDKEEERKRKKNASNSRSLVRKKERALGSNLNNAENSLCWWWC